MHVFYRIHGILSCYSSKFYLDFITKTLKHFGLDDKVKSGDLITLHDEYFSPGYDQNTPEQLGKYHHTFFKDF